MAKHSAPHHAGNVTPPLSAVPSAARRPPASRRRPASRVVSNVLIALGIILLLVAAGLWGFAQWRYHEQDVQNQKLAAYVQLPTEEQSSEAPVVDWAGLKAINGDVVGWLYVPGTTINYPVYQGDDNEYYLRHSAEGDWIIAGQLFMDYENSTPGMVDNQSIIYGHHLKNGTMFEQVAAMDDQSRFDEITTVWYVTETRSFELEPLMLYYTDPDDQNVRQFTFESTDAFHSYLGALLSKAVTRRGDAEQVIQGAEHVLTMSTCNYYDGYGRTILVCVPKSEANASASS